MAILDRPLFQRRPTMDQLRQYGIPAFANGGVVQRFAEAGEVSKLKSGEIEVISSEIVTKENGDIVRVKRIRQIGPRGLPIERTIEEVIEPATQTQKSKNPRDPNKGITEKTIDSKSDLRIAAEMETGAKNLADSARTSEEIVADVEKKKKKEEELDNSGLNNTDPEREKLTALEAMVKERSELYKKILGDPKEGLKQQGLLQLAQFGLNLASARGGNFAEKIANSAKDPLTAFAALGRESLKDERAIDMLAIKGAEDEMARTQKVGNFGQLVQDLMNQGLNRDQANAKATEIYQQKTGKTIAEMKDERYSELLVLYEKELGVVDEAIQAADAQIKKEFGTGMFLTPETPQEEPEVSRA